MRILRSHSALLAIDKSQQVLILLFESCWELFYPYLSNRNVWKLDTALTDKSLRNLYFKRLKEFYLERSIYSSAELEWIMKRGIDLTVVSLAFEFLGKVVWLKYSYKSYK